jgi:hypothetical protein
MLERQWTVCYIWITGNELMKALYDLSQLLQTGTRLFTPVRIMDAFATNKKYRLQQGWISRL